tara:strand:- start:554 stop:979 length:426 start_codon:yes stop_codon:yes gene_type:complete
MERTAGLAGAQDGIVLVQQVVHQTQSLLPFKVMPVVMTAEAAQQIAAPAAVEAQAKPGGMAHQRQVVRVATAYLVLSLEHLLLTPVEVVVQMKEVPLVPEQEAQEAADQDRQAALEETELTVKAEAAEAVAAKAEMAALEL